MSEKESIITRLLKRLGIIVEVEVDEKQMCEQAQGICNRDCEHCAWKR